MNVLQWPTLLLAGAASIVASATAQTVSLNGPISGVIYDAPSRSIRALFGFPGSAYLGRAILSEVDLASIAPDGDSALVRQNGEPALITSLKSATPIRHAIPDFFEEGDVAAWAANGGVAVVYSSSFQHVRRLDVRPARPAPEEAIDLRHLEGRVACLAMNADGSQTVIGFSDPTYGGLYLLTGDSVQRMADFADPSAAVFDASANLLYATGKSGQIARFSQPLSGSMEVLRFTGEAEPLKDPVGIALSRDGRRLYVAGGIDGAVREYDLVLRGLLSELRPEAAPSHLAPLAAVTGMFLLAPRSELSQPIWILDGRFAASVLFVPAGE